MSKDIWDSCFQQEISYDPLNFPKQPTQTDLEKRLGKELTEVFFQTCNPIDKIFFGRDKPLKGPGDKKMWINPSDRLDGEKIQITEQPSKFDCLQALTHRGILEIGGRAEQIVLERNKNFLEAKIKEAEDIARIEADLRIKFHVEYERAKLNEEWQQHFDELARDHEEEKKNLIKVFEDSRKVFCEFVAKKCQDEIYKHVEEAIGKTRQEMEVKCSKRIDDELAQQHTILQESMEVTLKNLEANDRDRMNELCNQCLNAMDVQNNLMMCRQITELMHLMSIEKNHWKERMNDLKDKYEMTIKTLENKINSFIVESSPEHQSNSFIVALWKRFFKSLKSIDVNELNECERGILNEIYRIQYDLIENYDDNLSRIFLVADDNDNEGKQQDFPDKNLIDNRMDQKDGECLKMESSVAVEWKRQNLSEVISIEDKFISSISHKMSKADASKNIHESILLKTASSIMTMVKGSEDDDRLLEGKIIEILHKLPIQQQALTKSDIIPLPNVDSSHIRDSREIIDKKISIVEGSVEGRENMLGVVDSLELLSHRTSMERDTDSNDFTDNEEEVTFEVVNLNPKETTLKIDPPYMEVPNRPNLVYEKMTKEEWQELKAQETLKLHSKRHSSVQFANSPPEHETRRTSILKNPPTSSARHDLHPDHNALRPIEEKCQELVNNMKFKSILKLLCADDIVNAKTSSTMSFDSQKK